MDHRLLEYEHVYASQIRGHRLKLVSRHISAWDRNHIVPTTILVSTHIHQLSVVNE